MCLNRIIKKVENPSLEEKTVYKIFQLSKGELFFQFRKSQNDLIKTNEWITARAQTVPCGWSSDIYETGFHCYLSKTAALENCNKYEVVKKVLVREITYYGTQHGNKTSCLVARQIFIPSDSEQKEEEGKKEK